MNHHPAALPAHHTGYSHRPNQRDHSKGHTAETRGRGKRGRDYDEKPLRERRPVNLTRIDRSEHRKEEQIIRATVHDSQFAPVTTQDQDIEKMTYAWKVQEEMWNSKEADAVHRCNVMRSSVHEMLLRRWNEGKEMVEKTTPEFPGLYLATVEMQPLDRSKIRYYKMTTDYVNMKFLMDRAIDENPHARALALIAMGPGIGGEQQLRQGTVPKLWNHSKDGTPLLTVPDDWNRHHEFQKSAKPADYDKRPLNDSTNLLYILTGKNAVNNPHHAIHGAILHAQTDFAPGQEPLAPIPVAIIKSSVPFYPPLRLDPVTEKRVSYQNTGQIMADLEDMEPGIGAAMAEYEKVHGLPKFQNTWAKRLVTLSEIARRPIAGEPEHQPFQVPLKYQQAAKDYSAIYASDIFDTKAGRFNPELQEDRRRFCAEHNAELAKSILPAGVNVNGVILPADHVPTAGIPVKDGAWGKMRPGAIPASQGARLSEEERQLLRQSAKYHRPPAGPTGNFNRYAASERDVTEN